MSIFDNEESEYADDGYPTGESTGDYIPESFIRPSQQLPETPMTYELHRKEDIAKVVEALRTGRLIGPAHNR